MTTTARSPIRLDRERIAELLDALPQWRFGAERGGVIARDFVFDDFAQAFAFMTRVARIAEANHHHPEWSNVYDRVSIVLTTHDAGGLSMRDIELAVRIDAAAGAFEGAQPCTLR